MEQTKVEFSSKELNDIIAYINTANSGIDVSINMVHATWNAILGREGKSLAVIDSLNPTTYAIPLAQGEQIMRAAMRRAEEIGLSDIGQASIALDFVNVGPSSY